MIDQLYEIFYEKLPAYMADIMPQYNGCKIITCLNPYYLTTLNPNTYQMYNDFDYICSDGIGPLILNCLFGQSKSVRLSFDMSSMTGPVFQDIMVHDEGLYVLGSKPGEVDKSVDTIKKHFEGIKIVGYHHGYIKDCMHKIVNEIIASGAKVVIIGMGAPMQDKVAVMLKENGFIGSVYTCGGFIHQTQNKIISFPNWTNKMELRWLYRIFTQKGMLIRLILTYPKFVLTYSLFLINRRLKDK